MNRHLLVAHIHTHSHYQPPSSKQGCNRRPAESSLSTSQRGEPTVVRNPFRKHREELVEAGLHLWNIPIVREAPYELRNEKLEELRYDWIYSETARA
jgi:hypothetical protein